MQTVDAMLAALCSTKSEYRINWRIESVVPLTPHSVRFLNSERKEKHENSNVQH